MNEGPITIALVEERRLGARSDTGQSSPIQAFHETMNGNCIRTTQDRSSSGHTEESFAAFTATRLLPSALFER